MMGSQFFYCSHLCRYMPIGSCDRPRENGKVSCYDCQKYKDKIKAVIKEAAEKMKEEANGR
jgi:hypothetical protein